METYKSDKVVIDHNIELIYSKLSNPAMFKEKMEQNMDRIPDEAREHLGEMQSQAAAKEAQLEMMKDEAKAKVVLEGMLLVNEGDEVRVVD